MDELTNSRDTWVPIERESEIKCNFSKCSAGMGLAGNGHCYRAGDPYVKECPKFEDEEKVIRDFEAGRSYG